MSEGSTTDHDAKLCRILLKKHQTQHRQDVFFGGLPSGQETLSSREGGKWWDQAIAGALRTCSGEDLSLKDRLA